MPDIHAGSGPPPTPGTGNRAGHALLMLYLAPFLSGAAGADIFSIPIFSAIFALAYVAQTSPALPLARRLIIAGSINLLIVTAVFALGRTLVWTGLIPQAPVELWLTLGMAAVAALLLRHLWANHRTARFAAQSLAALTGSAKAAKGAPDTSPAAEPASRSHAIAFELDLYAEAAETDGITTGALDDLTRALVRMDAEAEVQSALIARWREGPHWQAAMYAWLAHPFVTGQGFTGPQVADLFLQGMADRTTQLLAARAAMVWAEGHDFGAERAAVRATVAAHLADGASAPLPPGADGPTLRACLEQLDRTLRSA